MPDSTLVAEIRKRLADGEQIDWDSLGPEGQAACQVILDESRAAAYADADGK